MSVMNSGPVENVDTQRSGGAGPVGSHSMRHTAVLLLAAFSIAPAASRAQEARVRAEIRVPAPVVVIQEPAAPPPSRPPPRMPPPPAPPPRGDVVRVKEIKAGRVHARVIYAKEVKARDGRVGRILEDREDERWERGRHDGKIEAPEVFADVIYAKEIEADWIEAGEVHAKEVKIGK